MLRLGLTGGIGSGKSTVAAMLVKLGAVLIDADAIARNVTAPNGAAIEPIRHEFGADFIGPDGALNRDRMRTLAFADASAKKRLEFIVHPLVGQAVEQQAATARAGGQTCAVFDIPLLVESGRWRQRLDEVLVVDCGTATQIERVMARNGLARETVEGVIAAQATRLQRLTAADCVICNDGLSLDELRAEVARLAPRFGL